MKAALAYHAKHAHEYLLTLMVTFALVGLVLLARNL